MLPAHPCPRCGLPADRCGAVALGELEVPLYQCENCTEAFEMEGERFPCAYTFAVGPNGESFDATGPIDPLAN